MKYFKNDKEVDTILKEPFINITISNDIDKLHIYANITVKNNKESLKDIDDMIEKLQSIKNAMV